MKREFDGKTTETCLIWISVDRLQLIGEFLLKFVSNLKLKFDPPFSIGYPVVTLGFGFKSYVGYRIRQRKQRDVAKENNFYMQLLEQALPPKDEDTTAASNITNNSNINVVQQLQKETVNPIATNNTHYSQNNSNYNLKNSSNGHATTGAGSSASDSVKASAAEVNLQLNDTSSVSHSKSSHKKNVVDKDHLNNHMEPENCQILNNKKENHKNNHLNYNNLKNNSTATSNCTSESNNNSSYQINTNYSPFKNNAKDLMEKETIHSQFNTNTSTNKKEYEKNKFNKDSEYNSASGTSTSFESNAQQQSSKLKNDPNYTENPIKETKGKSNFCSYHEANQESAVATSSNNSAETSNTNISSHNSSGGGSNKKSKHLYQQQQRSQKDNPDSNPSSSSNDYSNSNNISSSSGKQQNKICDQCLQLEQEAKRLKSEMNSMKNMENEMRSTVKACLQAKQQDYEELRNQ